MKFKVGQEVKYNINNTDIVIGIIIKPFEETDYDYLIEVTKRDKHTFKTKPRSSEHEGFYFYESELTLIDFKELLKKAKTIRELGNKLLKT